MGMGILLMISRGWEITELFHWLIFIYYLHHIIENSWSGWRLASWLEGGGKGEKVEEEQGHVCPLTLSWRTSQNQAQEGDQESSHLQLGEQIKHIFTLTGCEAVEDTVGFSQP